MFVTSAWKSTLNRSGSRYPEIHPGSRFSKNFILWVAVMWAYKISVLQITALQVYIRKFTKNWVHCVNKWDIAKCIFSESVKKIKYLNEVEVKSIFFLQLPKCLNRNGTNDAWMKMYNLDSISCLW